MKMPLKEVPLEARRLAAQHIENVRNAELVRDAGGLQLGEDAVPIYRPDVDGIAYWEFSVRGRGEGRHAVKSRNYDGACGQQKGRSADAGHDGAPIGFVIVSNGRHDFPIAHWSLDRQPPSIQIANDVGDQCDKKGKSTAARRRLYRLDSLCYVIEDENEEICGQSGQIPALIEGVPHSLARHAGQIASSIVKALKPDRSDDSVEMASHGVERSKDKPPKLARSDEGGWKALKERYADAFGPFLDQLRTRAARTWEIEDTIIKFGEGIFAGESCRVALLGEACVELAGDGARFVRAAMAEGEAPCLILTADRVSLPHEMDVDLLVTYSDGTQERLRYFVVSRDVPSNTKAEQANSCDEEL